MPLQDLVQDNPIDEPAESQPEQKASGGELATKTSVMDRDRVRPIC
jgi:hypothetical protein